MDNAVECNNWTAVKAGDDLLVYGVCMTRSGSWTVNLVHDNSGVVPDPTTLKLKTASEGGGSTMVIGHYLPSLATKNASDVQRVVVNNAAVALEDLTPTS